MRVATFFSDSTWASWSFTHGLVRTLIRMGREVISCGVPAGSRIMRAELSELKGKLPRVEQLKECDAVLVCGPEHVLEWVKLVYGYANWSAVKKPKLGWYHESFVRPDYTLNFENYKPWIDFHFMPNPQDAEEYGQEWLPAGVDTEMFRPSEPENCFEFQVSSFKSGPGPEPGLAQREVAEVAEYIDPSAAPRDDTTDTAATNKRYGVAFVGLLYQKRADFLGRLRPHLGDVRVRVGNVEARGMDGPLWQRQTEMLAQTYREMKILLNLPSLSNVLVMKVLEAMACGTCVFTPHFNDEIEERLGLVDGRHLAFYREDELARLAGRLSRFLTRDIEREQIARLGCAEVHKNHRLEQRLSIIFEKIDGQPRDGSWSHPVIGSEKQLQL